LFGATTPLAQLLLATLSPFTVAGLFYLGSGSGLAPILLLRQFRRSAYERKEQADCNWVTFRGSRVQSPPGASPVPRY